METGGELGREGLVDAPMDLDPANALEGSGSDDNPEMGLAAGPCAGVSLVAVGLVDYLKLCRPESFG